MLQIKNFYDLEMSKALNCKNFWKGCFLAHKCTKSCRTFKCAQKRAFANQSAQKSRTYMLEINCRCWCWWTWYSLSAPFSYSLDICICYLGCIIKRRGHCMVQSHPTDGHWSVATIRNRIPRSCCRPPLSSGALPGLDQAQFPLDLYICNIIALNNCNTIDLYICNIIAL